MNPGFAIQAKIVLFASVSWIGAAWNSVFPEDSVLSLPDFITESVAVGALLVCIIYFLRHLSIRDQQWAQRDKMLLDYMRERDLADREIREELSRSIQNLSQTVQAFTKGDRK